MTKTIAITGATGAQGGGVANVMRMATGWTVRAVTRNPRSEAAKRLTGQGIEVVQADFDDEDSLARAFEGVSAIFAVTNWWEHFLGGKSRDEAGNLEVQQGTNLARAAAKTATLEHYIWSTLPSAKKTSGGKILVPHMDYKGDIDDYIKSQLPELAAKTTYLSLGYYPQNMAYFPALKPFEMPGSGGLHIQLLPTKADAKILLAGDMSVNPGIWVRQILASGAKTFGKMANVALELWTFQQMMDEWSRVTGKRGAFVECSVEDFTKLWGEMGLELAVQFKFGESCSPWDETADFVTADELGIDASEVVGFSGTIEGLKALF